MNAAAIRSTSFPLGASSDIATGSPTITVIQNISEIRLTRGSTESAEEIRPVLNTRPTPAQ
jgi:hypothetical protein